MKRLVLKFAISMYLIMSIISPYALTYQNVKASTREIRVGLKNMLSTNIKVTLSGNYKINNDTLNDNSTFNVSISGSSIIVDGKQYVGEVTIIPFENDNIMTLTSGAKKYKYFGKITFKVSGRYILPINTVDVESYLKGVVGYEMSNSYPLEALKAQAVSARGYAVASINKHKGEGFDICDSTDCQVYKGYNSDYKNVIKSVDDTRGEILYSNKDIVCAYFAASNGGYTEASENVWTNSIPYLITKRDDYDNEPWPYGDKTLSTSEIQSVLSQKGYISKSDKFIKLDIDNIRRYPSSRIASIDIIYQSSSGETKKKSFVKDSSRYFLSLPSSMYTVVYDASSDSYTFSGKGYGHGVGMSQIGARNRAKAGQTYEEILKFYYDGTEIRKMDSLVNDDSNYVNEKTTNNALNNSKEVVTQSKITDIVLNQSQIEVSERLNASVVLDSASNNKLFKYILNKNGKNVTSENYTAKASYTYISKECGEYTLIVYMKDKNSKKEYDDYKSINFNVRNKPKIKNIKPSKTNINENESINVNFDILSDSNRNALVRYDVILNGKVINKIDYIEGKKIFNIPFTYAGNYTIKFYVKDSQSTRQYDDSLYTSIKVVKNTKVQTSKITSTSSKNTPSIINSSVSISTNAPGIVAKKGIKGSRVKEIQQLLYRLGYYKAKVTSVYDNRTMTSVKNFQKANKLPQTGVVDNNTYIKIKEVFNSKFGNKPPTISIVSKTR